MLDRRALEWIAPDLARPQAGGRKGQTARMMLADILEEAGLDAEAATVRAHRGTLSRLTPWTWEWTYVVHRGADRGCMAHMQIIDPGMRLVQSD